MNPKRLYIRLSSLGDVILASTALEVISVPMSHECHWLVLQEYSTLLEGHPRLNQVLTFQKKVGLKGWLRLCRKIWESEYSEIYDLHCNLRTRLMKLCFVWWSLSEQRKMPRWQMISKQRFRLYGYYLLKKLWPSKLRPQPWVQRYAQFVGGTGSERPDLRHLLFQNDFSFPSELVGKNYICIMPSSRWRGKMWPIQHVCSLIQSKFVDFTPVILGTKQDLESIKLLKQLSDQGINCVSGIGRWSLKETAYILARSSGIIGVDTGLVHFAEALGVSSITIFGPTTPDMGFGPWRADSIALGLDLNCRPCSKDGRFCCRLFQPYHCLKGYTAKHAMSELNSRFKSARP